MTEAPHTQQPSRGSKFIKDMGVYAIGNIGSKVITFLMVPLYTFFVHDTGEFGYYDVCLTACFLLMPFVTLNLRDGAFRFLIDAPSDAVRRGVVNMVVRTLGVNTLLTLVIAAAIAIIHPVAYLWYTVALLLSTSLHEVLSQVMRGLGHNKAFVAVGMLTALLIGLLSVLCVAALGMGVKGIFVANILARLLALAIVEARTGLLRRHLAAHVDMARIAREVVRYSLPLLPGSLCWWLTGSSDRWFIMYYLGLDVNGVYAVAIRFTSILQTIALIFYQAWQETALLQYNSPDRDNFFTKMLNGYIYILCAILLGYAFMLKMNYGWLVAAQYQSSLAFIYPLGFSAITFAVVAFFDMGYQCAKDTARTLPAIVLAAVVNVVLNVVLTPRWGVWGPIATLIATNGVLVLYRWHDMKRYMRLTLSPRLLVPLATLVVGAVAFYTLHWLWADALAMTLLIAVALGAMPAQLRNDLLTPILSKFHRSTH